jgi:isocitrate dehydrogenase kinase/phosphatase
MGIPITRRFARIILNGFDGYFAQYQNMTLAAKFYFVKADWHAVHQASSERIDLYKSNVQEIADFITDLMGDMVYEGDFWRDAKDHYVDLIEDHKNYEIAETFFNSVYCKIFRHKHIDDEFAFVLTSRAKPAFATNIKIYNEYPMEQDIGKLLRRIFKVYYFIIPFEDIERDIRQISEIACSLLPEELLANPGEAKLQLLRSMFFRNKAAYIVGKLTFRDTAIPLIIPMLNNENNEVYIDTVILNESDASIIFSFSRSYFMVDAYIPSEYVYFLNSIMPHKSVAELYNAIGNKQHGKTEFHRDFVHHLAHSDDQFIIAPGIKGMVMSVFTLPSYNIVFKIIKDKFTPPKTMTRAQVMEKYKIVTRHDRAGRMADTQEFENFAFDKDRFSEELLQELKKVAPSLLKFSGNKIIIKHLYIERRMVPLNLFLQDATDEQVEQTMDEYGNAIKQLAGANIFPGDMLLKNFGVTRHQRVVFYDYDEICPLTECNFRKIPEPQTEEQELSSTPWYPVEDNDIFPEEFRLFFTGNPKARKVFDRLHSDIYQVDFWTNLQEKIERGEVMDVFPYRRRKRFEREDRH